jgi:CubicO group peptidase (beta-lactamase class C family)/pimeloyl-ACP methyl ester carboxylesterase
VILWLILGPLVWFSVAQSPQPDFADLEVTAKEEMLETNTPGAAVAVVSGDRVVFAQGFGVANIETGAPVTTETLFQIGSLTKMFTAAMLVRLAEEGKVKLNESVGRYVPWVSGDISRLTLHQLLSHTSGLKDVPGDYGLHDEAALVSFVRSWKDDACLFEPGKVFSYSNLGYALAGVVIQEISEKPYADVMVERLFKPLGMERTTFRPTLAMAYPLAVGHKASGREKPMVVRPLADDTRLWPAGYMYSSVSELARFAIAFLNGGRIDGQQMMPSSVVLKLSTPNVDVPTDLFERSKYGYGVFIHDYRGVEVIEHAGSMPGYLAEMWMAPDHRFAVIVLSNKDGARLKKTLDKAFELMVPVSPKSEPKTKPAMPISQTEITRYVGRYANRFMVDVFGRDGKLYLRRFGSEFPLTKVGENRFSLTPPGASQAEDIRLVPGSGEKPDYLQMYLWAFRKILAGNPQSNPLQEYSRLYEYDAKAPLDVQGTVIREVNGIKVYDITYASPKGGRVTGYVVVPPGNGPFAGLLFGHWGPGTRTEFLPEAMLYAEAGAVSVMIDYPWVRPAPWRRDTRDLSQPETDRDIFAQAVIDLRRGLDLLLSRQDVDPNRLAYVGHSYGAQWGAVLSAIDKRIKTAVLIGGVPALADIMLGSNDPSYVEFRGRTPKEQIEKYLEINKPLDAINYVPYAAPTSLLFQFARFERYFNEASMQRYAQAASEPKAVRWYDTGHELNDFQALRDRAEWLQRHVGIKPVGSILQEKLNRKAQ